MAGGKKAAGPDYAAIQAQNQQLLEMQAENERLRAAAATPATSAEADAAAKDAADAQKTLERNKRGRASTILTGGQGVQGETLGSAPGLRTVLG